MFGGHMWIVLRGDGAGQVAHGFAEPLLMVCLGGDAKIFPFDQLIAELVDFAACQLDAELIGGETLDEGAGRQRKFAAAGDRIRNAQAGRFGLVARKRQHAVLELHAADPGDLFRAEKIGAGRGFGGQAVRRGYQKPHQAHRQNILSLAPAERRPRGATPDARASSKKTRPALCSP